MSFLSGTLVTTHLKIPWPVYYKMNFKFWFYKPYTSLR